MTERHFLALLLFLSFALCAFDRSLETLGALFVVALLYATRLLIAREKDCRLESLRSDLEKQMAQLKDKMDSVLIRGRN